MPSERGTVFISYSHAEKDKAWLERLRVHLRPLERDGLIEHFDDTNIKPGADWRAEIMAALARAKIAILLVSADFLASDFIAADELPPLLKKAEAGGTIILPVILSPCRFTNTPALARFQAVNDPRTPLESLTRAESEAVLLRVADAVEQALHNGRAQTQNSPSASLPSHGHVVLSVEDQQKASLIAVLRERANAIRSDFDRIIGAFQATKSEAGADAVKQLEDLKNQFTSQCKKHLEAIERGDIALAHELVGQIHEILFQTQSVVSSQNSAVAVAWHATLPRRYFNSPEPGEDLAYDSVLQDVAKLHEDTIAVAQSLRYPAWA